MRRGAPKRMKMLAVPGNAGVPAAKVAETAALPGSLFSEQDAAYSVFRAHILNRKEAQLIAQDILQRPFRFNRNFILPQTHIEDHSEIDAKADRLGKHTRFRDAPRRRPACFRL